MISAALMTLAIVLLPLSPVLLLIGIFSRINPTTNVGEVHEDHITELEAGGLRLRQLPSEEEGWFSNEQREQDLELAQLQAERAQLQRQVEEAERLLNRMRQNLQNLDVVSPQQPWWFQLQVENRMNREDWERQD